MSEKDNEYVWIDEDLLKDIMYNLKLTNYKNKWNPIENKILLRDLRSSNTINTNNIEYGIEDSKYVCKVDVTDLLNNGIDKNDINIVLAKAVLNEGYEYNGKKVKDYRKDEKVGYPFRSIDIIESFPLNNEGKVKSLIEENGRKIVRVVHSDFMENRIPIDNYKEFKKDTDIYVLLVHFSSKDNKAKYEFNITPGNSFYYKEVSPDKVTKELDVTKMIPVFSEEDKIIPMTLRNAKVKDKKNKEYEINKEDSTSIIDKYFAIAYFSGMDINVAKKVPKVIKVDLYEFYKKIDNYENIEKLPKDAQDKIYTDDEYIILEALPNASYTFKDMKNLKELKINVDMSNVTSMYGMFEYCSLLTSLDVSKFDTKNVTNMDSMFSSCSSLTSLDVSKWDTKNVDDMKYMFNGCSKLTSLDVSNFDTKNVTNMDSMFSSCSSLINLDVSKWNTMSVTSMYGMFYYCSSLTSLDISNFDTKNVTDMHNMFNGCSSLTSLDVSKFDTKNVTSMKYMFEDCSKLTSLDISNFDTKNVTDMDSMFRECSSLTSLDVSKWNTKNVTDMHYMFYKCSSLTSLDVSKFDTKNVKYMDSMFYECSKLTSLDVSKFDTKNVTNMDSMFYKCSSLTSLDVSKFDTKNVPNMQYMFDYCSKLTSLDLSKFDTKNVTYMDSMFRECSKLTSLDLSNFDTKNVKYMSSMFSGCSSLVSLDVSKFDTKNVASIYFMFDGCSSIQYIILEDISDNNKKLLDKIVELHNNYNKVKVLTTKENYEKYKDKYTFLDDMNNYKINRHDGMVDIKPSIKLIDIDLHQFYKKIPNYDKVTEIPKDIKDKLYNTDPNIKYRALPDASGAFGNIDDQNSMKNIKELKINVDTSNITSMYGMFFYCSSLTSLDISNFNTKNVTSMGNMFNGCSKLTSLDVSKFDTKNVTNMYGMFYGCNSLTSLDVSNFDTKNVTNMYGMFYGCNSLTSLDVSKWNTENVTSIGYMFYSCSSLTSLDISHFDTKNVNNMADMFKDCSSLTYIILEDVSDNNKKLLDKIIELHNRYNKVKLLTTKESYEKYKDKYTFLDDVNNYKISRHDGMVDIKPPIKYIDIDLHEFHRKIDNYENITELPKDIKDKLYNTDTNIIYRALPNASYAFGDPVSSMKNIKELKINVDMSNVTDMQYMFWDCYSLTSLDVSKFDTKNVTNMDSMFYYCSSLTSLDVSKFDTKNVTDMDSMFSSCSSLTSLDISNFNTKNVTSMGNMFNGCSKLTSLDVSKFDTKNVTNMEDIFYNCSSLKYIILEDVSDNNKNLLEEISQLANTNSKLKLLTTKENYEKYKDKYKFLDDMNNYDINRHNGQVDVKIPVKIIDIDLRDLYKKIPNYDKVTELPKDIKDKLYNTNDEIMYRALPDAGHTFGDCIDTKEQFMVEVGMKNLKELKINVDMSNVTRMNGMFWNCSSLPSIDVSKFDTKNVYDIQGMFSGCSSLLSIDVSKFDTKNVTHMTGMFCRCFKLTSLDLSSFDTKNLTDMGSMFNGCSNLISLDLSNFNTKNITDTDMGYMFLFNDCSSLTYIILEDISDNNKNLLQVISYLSGIYNKVKVLTTKENYDKYKDKYKFLDDMNNYKINRHDGQVEVTPIKTIDIDLHELYNKIPNFSTATELPKDIKDKLYNTNDEIMYRALPNASKVFGKFKTLGLHTRPGPTSMKNLKELKINVDMSNVIVMDSMFFGCASLTSLDVSKFDTKSVINISGMFCYCNSLTSLDVSKFDTKNVTYMWGMFSGCSSLTSLDLSNFNTNNVTDMIAMFNRCSSLTSLDLSKFNTKNVTDMKYMFINNGRPSLASLNATAFNANNEKKMGLMFEECSSLTYIILEDTSDNNKYLLDEIKIVYDKYNKVKVLTTKENYDKYKSTYSFLDDMNNYNINRHNGMVDITHK